jgi:hypothetical protein
MSGVVEAWQARPEYLVENEKAEACAPSLLIFFLKE